jgi:hypothetical protein
LTVYYVPWDASKNLLQEVEHLYDEAGTFDCIEKDDLVAIKLQTPTITPTVTTPTTT